jgi:hypothetical protein
MIDGLPGPPRELASPSETQYPEHEQEQGRSSDPGQADMTATATISRTTTETI